jgi:cell division transport system permease protein
VWILEPRRGDGLIAALIEARMPTLEAAAAPLIAVSFAHGSPVDARSLGRLLRANGLTADVDDHHMGESPIWRASAVIVAAVLASWLVLVAGAFAVVWRAARRSLTQRGDVVNLLHLCGAGDDFIANLFRVRIGSRAGLAAGAGVLTATVAVAGWRFAAPPGPAWLDLAAPLPWLAIAMATAIGAVTLSTRAVLKPGP